MLHLRQTPLTAGTSSSSSCHSKTAVKNSVPDTCEINMVNMVNMVIVMSRIGEYWMVSDPDFDYGPCSLSC